MHTLRGIAVGFVTLLVLFSAGCKKNSSTGPSSPVSGDLFPVVQGRVYVYTESDVDLQNNPIAGSEHRVATMVGPSVTIAGRTGNFLIDSVYTTSGTFTGLDTLNIASQGSDGTIYFTLPPVFATSLPLSLPAVWFPMFQPNAGIGNVYSIYTYDTTSSSVPISFKLNGVINQQEQVQVPAGTYSAYRGDVTYQVTSGSLQLASGTATTMWLADGIGPVKILYPAVGSSTTGTQQVLIGKNF